MSRIAKAPINLPKDVEVNIEKDSVTIKGKKGLSSLSIVADVEVALIENFLHVKPQNFTKNHWAMAGTVRALLNNMVHGVSVGFERKLTLVGVGYRAQSQGKSLNLSLGFSHPVEYSVPEGITITTPSNTEIIVSGIDKQKVGQVAADIRAYRPPEPYKGKGVRYSDENVLRKEAKKK